MTQYKESEFPAEQLKNTGQSTVTKKISAQANDYEVVDVSRGNNYLSVDFIDVSH